VNCVAGKERLDIVVVRYSARDEDHELALVTNGQVGDDRVRRKSLPRPVECLLDV
jgi:hypothetical protein